MSRGAEPGRRSRLDIMYTILSLCQHGENRKTHIMYRCNLSYSQLQRYLEILTGLGLLKEDGGRYRITQKGESFLREFEDLRRLIE